MFNQQELQILIGGTEDPIDIDDLQANTVYGGAYSEEHETIKSFWKVYSEPHHLRYLELNGSVAEYRSSSHSTKHNDVPCYDLSPAVLGRRYCAYSFPNGKPHKNANECFRMYRGFKELNPKFSIRDSGSDNSRLPTASTCVNLLKVSSPEIG